MKKRNDDHDDADESNGEKAQKYKEMIETSKQKEVNLISINRKLSNETTTSINNDLEKKLYG